MFCNFSRVRYVCSNWNSGSSFLVQKYWIRECSAKFHLQTNSFQSARNFLPVKGITAMPNRSNTKLITLITRNNSSNKNNRPVGGADLILLALTTALVLTELKRIEEPKLISYHELVELLASGEIERIAVPESSDSVLLYGKSKSAKFSPHLFSSQQTYRIITNDIEAFEEYLREIEMKLGIPPSNAVPILEMYTPFITKALRHLLIIGFYAMLYFTNFSKMAGTLNPFRQYSRAKFTLIDPLTGQGKGVRFSDVAGLKEAKQEIMEFVDYLKRPEHYQALGAKVPKGALLLGPPGCGKTLLAKAVATEANVPFLSMNGSEFVELIGGLGAARVRSLFEEARNRSPCIIFIDEIDAIGRKRSGPLVFNGTQSEGEHTLNQLLVEMDGMSSREGVIMLASTNRAEILDKALLRPGRFDRHIMIDIPNINERKEIFEQHLKGLLLEHKPEYYAKRMASLTPGFTGADIANMCNEAALHAARYKKGVVTGEDLEYAVERVVGGTEKRSGVLSREEKQLVAYHEAGRALVGWLLENGEALLKISVVPRTNQSVGWTQFIPPEQFLFSKNELFQKMCMALGGRVAESLIFNRVSTKAEADLRKVTKIAYAQIRQYGMNEVVGLVSFEEERSGKSKPYSKQLSALIDKEARKLVAKAYLCAEDILRQNKKWLIILAEELLKRETLNYDEVVALIGPPKNVGKKIEPLEFDLAIERAAGPTSPDRKEEDTPRRAGQE